RFLGSEIDPIALASAQKVILSNSELIDAVTLRMQNSPPNIFKGLLKADETFDLSICNPPFHASREEAQSGSQRKWKNLGKENDPTKQPILNFGGQPEELWCAGGEAEFVRRMIKESSQISKQCFWFSSLLSKESNLPGVIAALIKAKVQDYKIIEMAQGQKKSRIVAWTFFDEALQKKWREALSSNPV
ncbi:MAG: RlmF-related methyltransferase, partial [Bdellovibrionia bacterium]